MVAQTIYKHDQLIGDISKLAKRDIEFNKITNELKWIENLTRYNTKQINNLSSTIGVHIFYGVHLVEPNEPLP